MYSKLARSSKHKVKARSSKLEASSKSWELGAGSWERAKSSDLNRGGFTFIEILMTMSIIAILFVPVMQLFSNSLYSTSVSLEMITAMNLAQSEMERTINLNLTKAELKKIGTLVFPPEKEKPIEMNHQFWRVRREIVEKSDPLEVRVVVYTDDQPDKSLVTLVTLVEDLMWDSVKAVSV